MYTTIDLSRMLEHPQCAIHVLTLEEAIILILNARTQFPERVKSWDDAEISNRWEEYKEETGFTLFFFGEDEPTSMSYADIPWFKEHKYQIVEFSDLLGGVVDIEESDQSVDILFGGGV